MKYAMYDVDGNIIKTFDKIDGEIPSNMIEIEDHEYRYRSLYKVDVINKKLVKIQEFSISLDEIKKEACTRIDNEAGKTRLKYITWIAGQEKTYDEKAKSAQLFKDAGYPDVDIDLPQYIYVKKKLNSLKINNPNATYSDAANLILSTKDLWIFQINPLIEDARENGKAKVVKSISEEEVVISKNEAIQILRAI